MTTALVLTTLVAAALPGAEDYLAGVRAERTVRYGDAVKAYQTCIAKNGPLAPYARLRTAYCRSRACDVDGAIAGYRALIDAKPQGPWTRMAQAYLASLYAERENHAEAVPLFDALAAVEPQPWWFDRYASRAADSRLALNDRREEGLEYYRQVLATTAFWTPRLEAAERLAESPEVEDQLDAAFAMLRSGRPKDAAKLLLKVARKGISDAPRDTGPKGVDAWALSWRSSKLEKLKQHFLWRKGSKAHELAAKLAQYWLAYTVNRDVTADELNKALARCDALIVRYSGSEATAESLWWIARRLERDDEEAEAVRQYLRLAKTCPDHYRADDALFSAGRLQIELGKTADALDTFKELRKKRYVDSRFFSAACCLSGVLHEADVDKKAAIKSYTAACDSGLGDYYAHRAYQRLHDLRVRDEGDAINLRIDGKASVLRPFAQVSESAVELPEGFREAPRYQRLYFFGRHGLEEGEWETLEIGLGLKQAPNAAAIYHAVTESGFAYTALEFAQAFGFGLEHGKPTHAHLCVAYPRAYWPQVRALGKEAGVDPYLILAVARQESTFRPALTSSAGARGVMQVMPTTATWLAKIEPNLTEEQARHLEIPLNSLRVGTYYLLRMIDQCGGNLVYALAAYNAGPGNLRKWRRRFPDANLDAFVERIPFRETRHYIKAVLGNYAGYHSLYPPTSKPTE